MRKTVFIFAMLGAVSAAIFYTIRSLSKNDEVVAGEKSRQEVSILTLTVSKIPNQQFLPGRVSPFRQAEVRPQVEGIIIERTFKEGMKVQKGQQLYKIDDARYKATLSSARADLESAKAVVISAEAKSKRYEKLVLLNAVSKQEYDDAKTDAEKAKAAVAMAQAAVDLAQVNLDYTRVYAPISGQIGRSFVTEGALVTTNQAQSLATITQLDPIYVDMQQSGSGLEISEFRRRIVSKNAIPVYLIIDGKTGENNYEQEGSLEFSEVIVDQTTSSVAVRASFPNQNGALLPGMFVRAIINFGNSEALLVPQRATSRTPDGRLNVWIVNSESKAQQRIISASQAYQDSWIVTSGLAAGDHVIVEGYQKVRDGIHIKAVPIGSKIK